MKAAFGAVLCHYGNIWYFYTTTNEFAEIGMVKFPVKISRKHSTQIIFMDLLPTFCNWKTRNLVSESKEKGKTAVKRFSSIVKAKFEEKNMSAL